MDDPLLLLEGRPVCRLSLSRGRCVVREASFCLRRYLREVAERYGEAPRGLYTEIRRKIRS